MKARDLLGIANHHRRQAGKKAIKSAITVWNRSLARNKRSKQASNHIGKGLFCTSKPPKAEDMDNESTHHQRAHVRNVQQFLCENASDRQYALIHSMDDKAYVRPGTSEGLEKTRKVRIINLTGEGAKQLPKYDWPEKLVYQTPSAHRIMTKKIDDIDGKKRLVVEDDKHVVVVRPKAFVDSSGSSWASEIVRLRIMFPDMFEIPDERNIPVSKRSYVSSIEAAAFLYKDMTEDEDIDKVTNDCLCPHRAYEKKRLTKLCESVQRADLLKTEG